jgi:hypothetical protein
MYKWLNFSSSVQVVAGVLGARVRRQLLVSVGPEEAEVDSQELPILPMIYRNKYKLLLE